MSDKYVKHEEILETSWTCPSCAAKNRGRDMKCPTCGAPKDESSDYALESDASVVTDADQVADAAAGEHWICAFCEKENRGRRKICAFCNADQTTRARKAKGEAPPPPPQKSRLLLGCGIAVAAVVGLVVLLIVIGYMSQYSGRVKEMRWEQRLHLQTKTLMHKEAWEDAVPSDAFEQRCSRRQRGTKQVVDRYRSVTKTRSVRYQSGSREECEQVTKDLGNGYAKRQTVCHQVPEYDYRDETYTDQEPVYRDEPVYADWCLYDVHEWPITKTVSRAGNGTEGLAWPDPAELGDASCAPCDPRPAAKTCCAREGRYTVVFSNAEDSEKPDVTWETPSVDAYRALKVGDERTLDVDDGKVTEIVE